MRASWGYGAPNVRESPTLGIRTSGLPLTTGGQSPPSPAPLASTALSSLDGVPLQVRLLPSLHACVKCKAHWELLVQG